MRVRPVWRESLEWWDGMLQETRRYPILPQIPIQTLRERCSRPALQGTQWEMPIAPVVAEIPDKWMPRSTSDGVHPNEEWGCGMPQETPVLRDADTSIPQPPRDAPSAIQEGDEAIPARNSFCGSEWCGHQIPAEFHRGY